MTIDYLAHHQDCIPQLAKFSYDEWRSVYNELGLTLDSAIASYRERARTDRIPLALVAVEGENVIGTGALKLRDLPIRSQYEPWLGGVYVVPEHRNRGVGTALTIRLVEEARRLGIARLYLWTPSAESLYAKLGWATIERLSYCGYQIALMQRDL